MWVFSLFWFDDQLKFLDYLSLLYFLNVDTIPLEFLTKIRFLLLSFTHFFCLHDKWHGSTTLFSFYFFLFIFYSFLPPTASQSLTVEEGVLPKVYLRWKTRECLCPSFSISVFKRYIALHWGTWNEMKRGSIFSHWFWSCWFDSHSRFNLSLIHELSNSAQLALHWLDERKEKKADYSFPSFLSFEEKREERVEFFFDLTPSV